MSMPITSSDAVPGPIPGTDRRHEQAPSSASGAAISASSPAASSADSLILLASTLACGLSAMTRHSEGRGDRRVDAGPARSAGHGSKSRLPRVDDAPGPSQGLHRPQPMGVGQRLERRVAFQEDAPEPVLVAGGACDHVAPLRRHRPCGLEPLAPLRHGQERVGDAERRLGDDGGVPLVGLRVAREQLGRAVGGDPGQVGDRQAGEPGSRYRERPDVADLGDDDQRSGACPAEQVVEVVLGVGHGPASQHLAPPAHMACPVGELSDIEPYDGIAGGGFAQHGGILPIGDRSERCLARHPHYLAVALFGRRSPAVSY